MRKFRGLNDGVNELRNIDAELNLAVDEDDLELCLEKMGVRSVVISQLNQLSKNHFVS